MHRSQRQLFFEYVAQTSNTPVALEICKGKGVYLEDVNGKKYIDLISGIGVSSVGHQHPDVLAALHKQTDEHLHLMVYGEFIQSPQVELAQLLSDNLPEKLNNCFFVNSGSEATEGALKLAKRYTGKSKILYFDKAYHGATHGALSIAGSSDFKDNFRPLLPGTYSLEINKCEELDKIDHQTAAVIIESIQGEAGVQILDTNFISQLRDKCNEVGALLIMDEVQTGAGRTGKMWGFEHYHITPDIITIGKGTGGGMPFGAFISSKEIMSCLRENPILGHITTFGGHPMSCVAAKAAIDYIIQNRLWLEAERKEHIFRQELKHPKIKEVRGKGLMLAVQLNTFEECLEAMHKGFEQGFITDWFLFCNTSLRIAPPLTITDEEIREVCQSLIKVLDALD